MMFLVAGVHGQHADSLLAKVQARLAGVSDYTAEGVMKTDVSFMKVPDARITVYYKQPDRFKIKKQDGISIIPKGGVNVNLTTLFAGNRYTAVGEGKGTLHGTAVAVVKLLPLNEQSDVVVSTLYIDEKMYLIRKAVITTRENGTYEMEMSYGKYANRGLPDKVSFIFSTKDYKLPKGLAIDYDAGEKPRNTTTNEKGKIEISYTSYAINTGLSNDIFN